MLVGEIATPHPVRPQRMNSTHAPQYSIRSQKFSAPQLEPGLYLVSTPIGNLGDITIRALETLAGCTVIACEDTRTSGVLLNQYGIDRPKTSYNEHNADKKGPDLIRQITQGAAIALISDAGTPIVCDPGQRLVNDAISANLKVIPIPGPSAPLAALSASGLTNEDFRFFGFLPHKKSKVSKQMEALIDETSTSIFFESPNRLVATLKLMATALGGDRQAVVARELTKMHETFHRGSLLELTAEFASLERVRGEIVVLLEGATKLEQASNLDVEALLRDALETMKPSQAAGEIARVTGRSRPELYALALKMKKQD